MIKNKIYKEKNLFKDINILFSLFLTLIGLSIVYFISIELFVIPFISTIVVFVLLFLEKNILVIQKDIYWYNIPYLLLTIFIIYLSSSETGISRNLYCLSFIFVLLPIVQLSSKNKNKRYISIGINFSIYLLTPFILDFLNPIRHSKENIDILNNNIIILTLVLIINNIFIHSLGYEMVNVILNTKKNHENLFTHTEIIKHTIEIQKQHENRLNKEKNILEYGITNNKVAEEIEKISWSLNQSFNQKLKTILNIIITKTDAKYGAIYTVNKSKDIKNLISYSKYKFSRNSPYNTLLKDVLHEEELMIYKNQTFPFKTINSHLGNIRPKEHIILPVKNYGIITILIEFSFIKEIEMKDIDLLKRCATIAATYIQNQNLEIVNKELIELNDRFKNDIENKKKKKDGIKKRINDIEKQNQIKLEKYELKVSDLKKKINALYGKI